jgi:hypothetical protein
MELAIMLQAIRGPPRKVTRRDRKKESKARRSGNGSEGKRAEYEE